MVRNDDSDIDMDATDVLGMIEDRDESMAKEVLRVVLSYRQRLKDVRAAAPPKIDGVPTVAYEKAVADVQVPLWDAINRYATTCGGDPSQHVYGNTPRMAAVADTNRVIHNLAARIRADAERETAAALARAERAEALVREAGVMLKEREWDEPVCPDGYLEGMACSNCLTHEDNKHDPGCHYAAIITRIAELDYTELD